MGFHASYTRLRRVAEEFWGASVKRIGKDKHGETSRRMTDAQLLAQVISDAYAGNANHRGYSRHGDPLTQILKGVTATQAAAKPKGATHSIWELVLHIANWEEIALRRLHGERVEWVQDSQLDWPRVNGTTSSDWKKALDRLARANRALSTAVARSTRAQLNKKVPNRPYNNEVMLHGTIHHSVYHAGQIALLKKLEANPC